MSKFLKLVSKYNSLLSEEDQVDPNNMLQGSSPEGLPSSPAGTVDPSQPSGSTQPAEQEQVSPDIESSIPKVEPDQLQSFVQSLYTYVDSENFKSDKKQEILDAMSGKDDMKKLPNILTNLSTIFNPETSQPDEETVKDLKSKDDYQ